MPVNERLTMSAYRKNAERPAIPSTTYDFEGNLLRARKRGRLTFGFSVLAIALGAMAWFMRGESRWPLGVTVVVAAALIVLSIVQDVLLYRPLTQPGPTEIEPPKERR